MLSTSKNVNQVFIAIVPAVLVIIAIAIYFFIGASQPQLLKRSSLVSPAEMRTRETFRANWLAIHASGHIPVSGAASASVAQPGMSQRAIDAYAARLRGVDGHQAGMSQAALDAYSARLSGPATQQSGMPQRAIAAYAARWDAMAKYYQSRSGK